jgi:hypothetical protein
MSNEFIALRTRARDKRDKAIAVARREYEAALVSIAALEQDLLGTHPTGRKNISSAIEAVIPRETTFTTVDLMAALEASDSTRNWHKRSVDWTLSRLREKGIVKRLKRASIHEPAVYVRADVNAKAVPLDDMTLLQVIGNVLTKPMTSMEVVVAVLEAGWQTSMSRTNMRNHVVRTLKKNGFKVVAGRWVP